MNIDLTKEVVRVLTWKPPYSTLMLPPHKKKETRRYATNVRGWVVIHEAQSSYTNTELMGIAGQEQFKRIEDALGWCGDKAENNGMCIGFGNLFDCRPMKPEDQNDCFVNYDPALFVWEFDDVRAIKPFPRKGAQGWRVLTEDEKQLIQFI